MRSTFLLFPLLLAIAAKMVSAEPFAPELFRIGAPFTVQEGNNDNGIRIPVLIGGGPATVYFALFTKDRAASIRDIRAGNLGWHYVNRIDTCIYVSPPYRLPSGKGEITWNGRDENDYLCPFGSYTYYLCGLADSIPAVKAFSFPSARFDRSAVVMDDGSGNPLSNPVFFSAARPVDASGETWNTRARRTLGGDPEDAALLETTRYRSYPDRGRMAVDPNDTRRFFTQSLEPGKMLTRAWEWTPNGDAMLRTRYWGDDGDGWTGVSSALDPETAPFSGPVSDGTYLFSTDLASGESGVRPTLDCIDYSDGALVQRRDLSPWFGDDTVPDELAGSPWNILLSSPRSAQFLAVNPLAGLEDADYFAAWENGVGDGFADTPPAPGTARGTEMDRNGFALFAESGPAIGVLIPDGAGAGFVSLSGVTGAGLDGIRVVDTGSAYDGLYFGATDSGGEVRYAGYDVFKGVVQFGDELWDSYIRLLGPRNGQELRAGTEYTVIWEGGGYGDVRLEFSEDGGATWSLIADGPSGRYVWRVPDVHSSDCRLRVLADNSGLTDTSYPFTISGPVAIADATPHAFVLRQNTPNPFNPSTAISFTLPAPGNVSLVVYDATGRKVTELVRGFHAAGEHSAVWNAKGCASGVYFAVLKAGERTETRKMLLVR